MEDENVKMDEIEEIETDTEVEETCDGSNAGALFAGVVGGFIAYVVISGAAKLRTIIEERRAAKKRAEADTKVVDVEFEEADTAQTDADTESSGK